MALPVSLAGLDLTADVMTYAFPLVAIKASDQSATSNTTLFADSALFLAVAASSTYEVHCEIFWLPSNNSTTPGMDFEFTTPAGCTGNFRCQWTGADFTSPWNAAVNGVGSPTSSNDAPLSMHGILQVGATAGTLQFEWCQFVSSATSTTVKATSFLVARRIG